MKLSVITLSKILSVLCFLETTAFTSTAALALNILNQDGKRHEVEVNFNYGTTKGSLKPNTKDIWYSGTCEKGCKVKVKDIGQVIDVKNDDLIVIKDGAVTVIKAVESF